MTTRPDYVDALFRQVQGADLADPPHGHPAAGAHPMHSARDPDDDPFEPPHPFAEGIVYGLLISSALWALIVIAIVGLQ